VKLYTRTGDEGETGLYGGSRVAKDHPRIEACGAVDECNATLGFVLTVLEDPELGTIVTRLQNELFTLGGDLGTALSLGEVVPRVHAEMTMRLEWEIDRFEQDLNPLRNFILPGGGRAGAALHVARAICRRAERRITTLSGVEKINPEAARYINRLSDLLFVAARLANHRAGAAEIIWKREE
jgi:cob(I)alamin adenosyltransferase